MSGALGFDMEVRKLSRAMDALQKDGLPKTVAQTLNETAHDITVLSEKNVRARLNVRTSFTTNSLTRRGAKPYKALNKAMGTDIDRMFARAGTFSPYLWRQEGDVTKGLNGSPVPIPTDSARTSQSRGRSVRKKYRLSPGNALSEGSFAGEDRIFVGKPRGGDRPFGVWERSLNNSKGMKLLRVLEYGTTRVPDSNWFDDAVRRHGSRNAIRNRFVSIANEVLRRFKGR